MKKSFLVMLLAFATIFLTSFDTEKVFKKDGITFSIPEGWKITEEENFDNNGYYLACEKTGLNASGLATITWVNSIVSTEEMTDNYKESLTKNFLAQKAHPKFTPLEETTYNSYECSRVTYTFTIMNVDHRGVIYCFYACDKTVTVMLQEAIEDIEWNKAGFKTIGESLKCL